MKAMRWLTSCVVLAGLAASAVAGSIWDKAQHHTQALYTDDTARAVGDNITIMVEEKSVIANDTKRDMNKKSDRSYQATAGIDFRGYDGGTTGRNYSMGTINASSNGETKFVGEAKLDSSRSVVDEITVTVQDVLPNGNLVVLGTRSREITGDREVIEVSGIVRPSDITYANTVLSGRVANFHVVYRHKGQENDFTNPGWLERVFNTVSPY